MLLNVANIKKSIYILYIAVSKNKFCEVKKSDKDFLFKFF